MNTNLKRYWVRFSSAMALYLAMVIGARLAMGLTENSFIQHFLAIVPVLPAMAAAWVLVVYVRTLDEVQRAITAEAAIISFFIVGFGTLTYGFLESFLDYPQLSVSWVLPALSIAFGFGTFLARRKYL